MAHEIYNLTSEIDPDEFENEIQLETVIKRMKI
jgi:hypothetical protein